MSHDTANWILRRGSDAVVDFEGVPGPLGFYVAEAVDSDTIVLHHRDGDQPPLAIETFLFHLEYRKACDVGEDPESGFIFNILRKWLPPLCEACGRVATSGLCCELCWEHQVDDLVRMADPERGPR